MLLIYQYFIDIFFHIKRIFLFFVIINKNLLFFTFYILHCKFIILFYINKILLFFPHLFYLYVSMSIYLIKKKSTIILLFNIVIVQY